MRRARGSRVVPMALSEFRLEFPDLNDETAVLCARLIAGWKPLGPGRVGRHCSVGLARQSALDRQNAARGDSTLLEESAIPALPSRH
jgi:hypothetical protein